MTESRKHMTPKQLLQQCEVLTHNVRMHRMVEFGRLAASDANADNTISILARGDVYQRVLATQSCYGSRNAAQTLQALCDPSHSVRALALQLVALICSDAELQDALALLPLDLKEVLLRHLQKRRRQAPIDTHLETLASRHDAELKKLVPFGSRAVVIRHLGQVIEQLDLVTWRRLAHRYPELVVEHLRARPAATLDPLLIIQVNAVLPLLTRCAPDLALDLVRTLLTTIPLARLDLHALLQRRPNEIAELVLQANERSPITFNGVAHRLDTARLLALFTRHPAAINTQCFEKLTPQQRLVAYTACERGGRSEEGVVPYHDVASLPAAQRLQEGRRHLALPALTARPLERLRYAAFSPSEEARATLDVPLRSPDADLRSAALQALIAATRYLREHLADVLHLP